MRKSLCQLLLVIVSVATPLFAEVPAELVIGVPPYDGDSGLVGGDAAALRLVRSAVTAPLLVPRRNSPAEQALFTLILVDSFQVDPSLTTWSFRLRDDIAFANGQSLRAADACDSLKRCVRDRSDNNPSLVDCEVRSNTVADSYREWIDLRFDMSLNSRAYQRSVIDFIAACPVFEARSRDLFGKDFGTGSNILAAGEYRLAGFQQGKSYRLERYQRTRSELAPVAQSVEILSYDQMKEALTALRVGTIGMFINTDPAVAAAAAGDETLRIGECGGRQVIYRRGYRFECAGDIVLSSINFELTPEVLGGRIDTMSSPGTHKSPVDGQGLQESLK